MEKYVIIGLVLLCVFLGTYARRLQCQLAKSNEERLTLKAQKQFLLIQKNQNEMIYGVMDIKYRDQTREIALLTQRLRIAEISLARMRNRLRSK